MRCAGLLLTGGASRRMGRDKATIPDHDGRSLAVRTAGLLAEVAAPVVEVGPGHSGERAVADTRPGAGPLAAVATGIDGLAGLGWDGDVLVVATDLPRLRAGFLAWLAGHGAPGPVVPVVDGRPQYLCARYDAATLASAGRLVAAGRRRMSELLDGTDVHLALPGEWSDVADEAALRDADTPAELAAAGLALPGTDRTVARGPRR